jgi:NADPH:quinone reductase-like Zn-dependent oxidoreductase
MKAVVLHGYGDVTQLHYETAPDPEPGPGEVLIQLTATSVNPIDWKLMRGEFRNIPLQFPAILGRDIAGIVVALGSGVSQPALGTKVMGIGNRAHAELVAAKADTLTEIPEGLPDESAAALALVGLTGAQLVENLVRPQKGETVLVTGAVGSVGRVAVYVLQQQGARVIAGVRGTQLQQAEILEASRVVALDDEHALSQLRDLDAIADTVDHEVAEKLLGCLRPGGTFATVLAPPKAAQERGFRVESMMAHPDPECLAELATDLARGRFYVPIGKTLSLSSARDAYAAAQRGGSGKIVMFP